MALPALTVYGSSNGVNVRGGRWPGGRLSGNVAFDAAAVAGSFGISQSALAGAAALDGVAPGGGMEGFVPPSWLGAVGEWGALPNSTLTASGVGWAGTPPGGTGNYQTLVEAYSGGMLNTVGVTHGGAFIPGPHLILFGGGHGDYAGNELYAYGPLDSSTPIWRRLTDPTIPAPNDVGRLNGYPVSRHSYDSLVFLPALNKMLCIGAAGYYHTGNPFNQADVFDFAVDPSVTNPWSTADTGFPAFTGGGTINIQTGYNPNTQKAWGIGTGNATKLCCYDVASGTWSSYYKDHPNAAGNGKAALDPVHNLLVMLTNTGAVVVQDLGNPNNALFYPTVTGTGPGGTGNNMLDWSPTDQCIVSWGRTGKTVYYLTPGANPLTDAWAWTSATPAGGATPADGAATGTMGRFRIIETPYYRGILLMSKANSAIHLYRMG